MKKTAIILLLMVLNFTSNAQLQKLPCDTGNVYLNSAKLNTLKVGVDFTTKKYEEGYRFINEDGFLVTLIEWKRIYNVYGIDVYRWVCVLDMGRKKIIILLDEFWIKMASDNNYYDRLRNDILTRNPNLMSAKKFKKLKRKQLR